MTFRNAIVLYGQNNWEEVSNHVGKSQLACQKYWNKRNGVGAKAQQDWLKDHGEYIASKGGEEEV